MATPTVTYTFSNSTVADAAEINTNFADLINALTDGTSDHAINTLTLTSTLTANGNVTLGNASSDTLTVNATPTFAAATTFSNSVTVTGTANLNGDVNIGDDSGDTITVDGTTTFNADTTIGAFDFTVDTNTLFVDASEDQVGINTTSPLTDLHVTVSSLSGIDAPNDDGIVIEGSGNVGLSLLSGSAGSIYFGDAAFNRTGRISYNHSSDSMFFETNSATRMVIDSTGDVGIGTSSPNSSLHVEYASAGDIVTVEGSSGVSNTTFNYINCKQGASEKIRLRGDGTIYATNTSIQSISDRRLKKNISRLENALSKIMKLEPSRWAWKDEERTGDTIGFIAQDLAEVFPEMVSCGAEMIDKSSIKTVGASGNNMIAYLVASIQEQQAMIEKMQAEIDELKK